MSLSLALRTLRVRNSSTATCLSIVAILVCRPIAQSGAAETNVAEAQFAVLAKRYEAERTKVFAEALNVTESSERSRLFRDRDPANTMCNEFLELEEKFRGSKVGLSALYHLVSVALGSYGGDPQFPVTEAGRRALVTLTAHYAEHPDLDVLFPWLRGGGPCGEPAKALVRRAMTGSHRHIRGTAMLSLADILKSEAEVPSMIDAQLELIRDQPEKFHQQIQQLEKVKQNWVGVDSLSSRQESLRLLGQVMTEYSDVLESPRANYGPIILNVEHSPEDTLTNRKRRPLAQLAESKRLQLTTLAIGQTAPEIAGPDAFGSDLKLSDQRGKVVVLMFSFKGCGPCEAMYPDNRQLVENNHGRPFRLLGVMGDQELATVKEAVNEKKITWSVWWDGGGTKGPVATRWNVVGWPDIYVLDHDGVIRYRELRGDVLALAVAKLVESAEHARE